HAASDTRPDSAMRSSDRRQSSPGEARGTARIADSEEPTTKPAAYAPDARPGRFGARRRTVIDRSGPAIAIPAPAPKVSRSTIQASGTSVRATPKPTVIATHAARAFRGPSFIPSHGPTGAKTPRQRTGMV